MENVQISVDMGGVYLRNAVTNYVYLYLNDKKYAEKIFFNIFRHVSHVSEEKKGKLE